MTEQRPTPEQVESVGRIVMHEVHNGATFNHVGRRILTTHDADAQAALAANLPTDVMLAALTERGALTEVRRVCQFCYVGIPQADHELVHFDGEKRQYVTDWREVTRP